ncbi:e3 ubiquitin-protein ligase AMFR [Trichonephila clavipes]|nr:e3 ubiquitin-protein ligase AMFR [Trichonephila clavipes]
MPSVPFERIPLPSLQTYTTISVVLFSCSIYYAIQVTSDPNWVMNVTENTKPTSGQENIIPMDNPFDSELNNLAPIESHKLMLHKLLINNPKTKKLYEMLYVIVEEPLCVWTLINMVYCVMILIGKCIQKIVFGDLRAIEQQHIKDKFWNFVFYKFIFIFGVMNVQYMDEVLMWCGWFSFVGAFHLLSTLCKDRFEYLSFSPTTPKWAHLRLFSLIFFILAVSVSLCTIVGLYANLNIFFFMAAEWTLVIIRTVYVLVRYIIYLYDITYEGVWENRGVFTYYCELACELSSLVIDFLHHVHMLLWRNIFLSVASLIICMQLRCFINDIQRKILRHKNYLRVSRHLENNFSLATKEELDANSDDCAICWDRMESARKLPCGHFFHTSCLHSWLEQVTNCPTCRTSLVPKQNTSSDGNPLGQDPRQPTQTTNHFFHFDGSRYVSWLPSFSVEVSHTSLLGDRPPVIPARPSQLDSMVHQVLQMFPHMPYSLVLEDLLITHSVEQTVENILEERLVAPPTTTAFPPSLPTHNPEALMYSTSFLNWAFRGNRASPSIGHSNHPAPLMGRTPDALHLREANSSTQNGSSDSGISDNTVRTEESTIVTGGDGCRFSKNSQERQNMLSSRKEELLKKARSKYISRVMTRPIADTRPLSDARTRNIDSSSSE